jgi:hypothetical protein
MHSGAALCVCVASDGPGDSGRVTSLATSSLRSIAVARGAPHISQVVNEG